MSQPAGRNAAHCPARGEPPASKRSARYRGKYVLAGTLSRMTGYDDGRVACTDDEIILRHYSMFGRDKHINYQAIREVRQFRLSNRGKHREHGSSDGVHWFNADPGRKHKDRALVIYITATKVSVLQTPGDTDEWAKPVMTPDDPDRVIAELAAHGVNVTNGEGDEGGCFLPM